MTSIETAARLVGRALRQLFVLRCDASRLIAALGGLASNVHKSYRMFALTMAIYDR